MLVVERAWRVTCFSSGDFVATSQVFFLSARTNVKERSSPAHEMVVSLLVSHNGRGDEDRKEQREQRE